MDAKQLFDAGRLAEAIAAQTREVKNQPGDLGRRTFLFELLCFQGDYDRAAKQLDAIGRQELQAGAAAQVYANLLHAENARRRLYSEGLAPKFLIDPPPRIHRHLDAVNRLREGNAAEAKALLDDAESERPELPGQADGVVFEDFRDCDDLLSAVLELHIGRDYCWVPFEQIRSLQLAAPEHPRDLIWSACQMILTDGTVQRGHTPVLYSGSQEHENEQVKLGRMTDWKTDDNAPVLGAGQRMLIVGDDARTMLDLRMVEFKV